MSLNFRAGVCVLEGEREPRESDGTEEKDMRKLLKVLVLLLVVGAVATGIYAWIRNRGKGENGTKLVEAKIDSITEKAVAVGQIEPRLKFSVKSKVSGIVRKCYVEVGDHVKPGDPLFEIAPDPTPQELIEVDRGLQSTQASYERAKADYLRYQELHAQGVVSKGDLDARKEAFDLATVALNKARQSRELTTSGRVTGGGAAMETIVRSPAAGTILTREVDPGDPVVPLTSYQPGTEMATVAEMNDLIFKGTVDEIDVGKMKVGMPVRIKVGALPKDLVTGRVSRIAPQAQKKEGSTLFDVEIELDPTTDVTLRAGYSANADVIIREKKDVLVIPERLVIFEDEGRKTFVEVPGKSEKDEPKKIPVTIGLSDGLNVEILSGLKAGDRVVERPPREII
ncbi:MAG: efflux RND transporter periplasmic adaptor subunit [Acidobacteriota bacterium]